MKTWLPAVIASHLLFWICWPLAVAAPVLSVARHRLRGIIPLIALSPLLLVPVLCFSGGILEYKAGTAVLKSSGLPGPEFYNLDPELRCHRSTSGCLVDGSEAFRHGAYNAAVRWMIRSFGPMTGAYGGAYPTRAEVVALLAQEPRRLSARERDEALRASDCRLEEDDEKDVRWAVIDVAGEALLVASPVQATLFDRATGRVFARYRL